MKALKEFSMNVKHQPISPAEMNKELLISKCNFFVEVHIWPLLNKLNPQNWLTNFKQNEMEYAVHLLNSFMYFSDEIVDAMFVAAFHNLSNKIRGGSTFLNGKANWQSFLDTLIITPVTGETPNVSDSGNQFARKARKLLAIRESQLMDQKKCIEAIISDGLKPVVFVDDFVGSGEQFLTMWNREMQLESSGSISFKKIAEIKNNKFFYCPVICTEYGYDRIRNYCPEVVINPAHILSNRYSALANDSVIWPKHLQNSAYKFLHATSVRAGLGQNCSTNDWRGFHNLGLAIAFDDSVPDATLPIFYWEENGWKPLIKRT